MDTKKFYITTTIPYVNAKPHIGFALEAVQADTLARYQRLMGRDVFYNAGTDEHGQKIWEKAKEQNEDVRVYVDRYADSVRQLKDTLNLSYDNFVRTTDPSHVNAAQELWRRCEKNGDIYKKKYSGLYCIGCEKFLSERDLVDEKCPIHPGQNPIVLEEENYFFRLSKYQAFLEAYLARPNIIVPEHRKKEAAKFVAEGLEDFSISREKEKLPWGVPVPGDETQVMYVWFDALTNYISTLGWPAQVDKFKSFWEEGETLQMAGKDQVRFQSIMWPAMLSSAGLKAPDRFFYHGFINSGGQRMSKSLGNVIDPQEVVSKYGTDGARYIFLRHVHATDDTDVTWEKMDEWYNANLANGLGNLVARVMKMAEEHLDATPDIVEDTIPESLKNALELYDFNRAADIIWEHIGILDERIQRDTPFLLVKQEPERGKDSIRSLVADLHTIGSMLAPLLPKTTELIKQTIRNNKKPETLFPRI